MEPLVVRNRPAEAADFTFLARMLGEAAVWRPDKPTPTADQVVADPRYAMYLAGWPRQGDVGLVAEQGGPVGAAWYRTYTEESHGHGFIAEDVPELSIAVIASRRQEGIGRSLLRDLIEISAVQGYPAVGLSVAFVAGATTNWLQNVGDHFAERSLGWRLFAASSIGHVSGITFVMAGVVTGA